MSEASVPRAKPLVDGRSGGWIGPAAWAVAGAAALAIPLLWARGPAHTLGDTLAFAAWGWVLLGVPLMAVLVIGGVGAARKGKEPKLLGALQWFAVGMAAAVVLVEIPCLLRG
ncbi:hypothetical protein WCE55_13160 [Luteimonas sp. MJ293]|uniref:hypothetical protein n=1 Tax=Luteimonas sp. MJ146 TaxID=3129240 RepID=UPI0031BB71E0